MNMLDLLKRGFGYVLMSMGVSSPAHKPAPKPKAAAAPESKKGE
ncbi:MAG: hypothetical protein ABR928_20050 [Terracidiphilus sp.]|jgi:hypothetical protein